MLYSIRTRLVPFLFVAVVCLLFSSCRKDSDEPASATPETSRISVIFPPNALGDNDVNDKIYAGIFRIKEYYSGTTPLVIEIVNPDNEENATDFMRQWFENTATSGRRLLVVVGEQYASQLERNADWRPRSGSDVLLLESNKKIKGIYTHYISLYGLCHYMGQRVYSDFSFYVALINANKVDFPQLEVTKGFCDGFDLLNTEDIGERVQFYLADSAGMGYDSPEDVFKLCYDNWDNDFNFVLPSCGGSAQGVYRYLRTDVARYSDYPIFTCGIGSDMSLYAEGVLYSIIKRYDLYVEHFVYEWVKGAKMPSFLLLGMTTEYVEFLDNDIYGHSLDDEGLKELWATALAAEKEHFKEMQEAN